MTHPTLASAPLTRISPTLYTGTLDYPVRGGFAVSLERIDPETWQLRLTRGDRLMVDTRLLRCFEEELDAWILHGFTELEGYVHQLRFTGDFVLALIDAAQPADWKFDLSFVNPPTDYTAMRGKKRK